LPRTSELAKVYSGWTIPTKFLSELSCLKLQPLSHVLELADLPEAWYQALVKLAFKYARDKFQRKKGKVSKEVPKLSLREQLKEAKEKAK
jgi:hypothetical protein